MRFFHCVERFTSRKFFEGSLFIDDAKPSKTTKWSTYKIKSWCSDNHWICCILLLVVVFYYEGLCFRHFCLFILSEGWQSFIARVILFESWEIAKAKVEVTFHQQTQQIDDFWNFLYLIEMFFKNFRFVVVDLVCMFNLSLLVTALATTTILLRLKSPANSGKRNLQHGKNRHWIWKVVGFWCIQVCWFLFFRIDINVC